MNDPAYPDALPAQYRMHWYTIERVLGQGGFGITYLARDTNLDQLVAIKEYLPVEVAARTDQVLVRSRSDGQRDRYRWGLERFIQEARTLAKFDHPNIVRVHSVFEHNGTAYMVMRFEEGDNLGTLLERRGTLPEKELLRILLPILDGLALVHGAGFIHRDIKPDNIHIRADGSPVLLDFGSARHALGKSRTLTILVAPGYAPFEQYYSSSENQGPWTDIYGLGATCYRAIAGTPPLDAITRSKGILGSTREVLVPASTIGHGRYSSRLLAAVDHALAFAEKDRPQTVAAWRQELTADSMAAVAAPPASAAPRPVEHSAGPGDRAPVVAAPVPAGSGARAPLIWATVGAVAGALAIAVFLRVSGSNNGNTQPAPDGRMAAVQAEDEKKRADEADRLRKAREAEEQRLAEEAKRRRQAQEAEQKRLAEEREKARLAEDEERKRQARLAEEEKRRVEAEIRRQAEAAERKRRADAAETQRLAKLAENERQAREAEKARRAEETERARRERAQEQARGAAEAAKRQLDAAADAEQRGNLAEARRMLESLARTGNAAAQARLGAMHEEGRGGPRDVVQAYIWYSLAIACGNAPAGEGKARVLVRMQQAQVNQADRLVASLRYCGGGGSKPAASMLTEGDVRKASE